MGRSKIYESDAERKKAYRLRLAGHQSQIQKPVPSTHRPPSRPKRLAKALSEVEALQQEYEGWLSRSAKAELCNDSGIALQETVDKLAQAAELLAELELPKGFGRD